MSFVNWINRNQGLVMCSLTLVYSAATIVIVFLNNRTIKEMRVSREAESRPYVFAYLDKDPRDMCFYLRIKNYGKSGAKIEAIAIFPDLKLSGGACPGKFLENVILAPQQCLEFIVVEKKDETMKHDYIVSLQYTATANSERRYEDEYTLILQYAKLMGYTNSKMGGLSSEANELRNIANHLDSMRRKMC